MAHEQDVLQVRFLNPTPPRSCLICIAAGMLRRGWENTNP